MYYSKSVRERKVKELEGNKEFIAFAQKEYETYKRVGGFGGYNTFEEYLVGNVFVLYENFTMLEFIKKADKETISRALDRAFEEEFGCEGLDSMISDAKQKAVENSQRDTVKEIVQNTEMDR